MKRFCESGGIFQTAAGPIETILGELCEDAVVEEEAHIAQP